MTIRDTTESLETAMYPSSMSSAALTCLIPLSLDLAGHKHALSEERSMY